MSWSPKKRPGHRFVFCSVAVASELEPLPSQLGRQAPASSIAICFFNLASLTYMTLTIELIRDVIKVNPDTKFWVADGLTD